MSKMGNHILGVEELVDSLDIQQIISESEHLSEAQTTIVEELNLNTFDAEIACNYVSEMWNEFWGNYV